MDIDGILLGGFVTCTGALTAVFGTLAACGLTETFTAVCSQGLNNGIFMPALLTVVAISGTVVSAVGTAVTAPEVFRRC